MKKLALRHWLLLLSNHFPYVPQRKPLGSTILQALQAIFASEVFSSWEANVEPTSLHLAWTAGSWISFSQSIKSPIVVFSWFFPRKSRLTHWLSSTWQAWTLDEAPVMSGREKVRGLPRGNVFGWKVHSWPMASGWSSEAAKIWAHNSSIAVHVTKLWSQHRSPKTEI